MAKTLQHRRGTTAELASVTGAIGEIFMDTTKNTLVVMDGTTAGGIPLAKASQLGTGGTGSTGGDAVFDTALIGDVTIIGNTISGVDSYGNADTLALNAPVLFTAELQKTTAASANISTAGVLFDIYYNNYAGAIGIINISGISASNINKLLAIPVGTVIATNDLTSSFDYGTARWKFTVSAVIPIYDPYNPTSLQSIYYGYAANSIQRSTDGGATWNLVANPSYNLFANNTATGGVLSYTSTSSAVETVGSVTELSATFPNIVTNSINSKQNNLSIDIDTVVVSNNTLNLMNVMTVRWMHDSMSNKNYLQLMGVPNATIPDAFKAGMTVNAFVDGAGQKGNAVTFTLTSDMAYSMVIGGGTYVAETPTYPNDNGQSYTQIDLYKVEIHTTKTTGGIKSFGFDSTGVFNADSILTDSALIGDVSIVGNTIASVDSYGNAAALNISTTDLTFDSAFNLNVDSTSTVTETVTIGGGSMTFSTMGAGPSISASTDPGHAKFKAGTIVSAYNNMVMSNVVVVLTADMSYSMANGWSAPFTVTSGTVGSSFNVSSVSVTNTTGSLSTYGFSDSGLFSAESISANSLSINGSPISGLSIAADGVSKAIPYTAMVDTVYPGGSLYWGSASSSGTMDPVSRQGKLKFQNPNAATINLLSSLPVGAKITLGAESAGFSGWHTYTVQTQGFNYDMLANYYFLDVVEVETNSTGYNFLWLYDVTISLPTPAEYVFGNDGFVAPSALVGDVSIVGNTIAAVDSYGLPGQLHIDGALSLPETTFAPGSVGSPVKWVEIYVAGTKYFMPLYQ